MVGTKSSLRVTWFFKEEFKYCRFLIKFNNRNVSLSHYLTKFKKQSREINSTISIILMHNDNHHHICVAILFAQKTCANWDINITIYRVISRDANLYENLNVYYIKRRLLKIIGTKSAISFKRSEMDLSVQTTICTQSALITYSRIDFHKKMEFKVW